MKIVSFPKRTFDWLRINSSKSSSDLYCDSTNRLLPCKMVITPPLLSGKWLADESFYSGDRIVSSVATIILRPTPPHPAGAGNGRNPRRAGRASADKIGRASCRERG